jgi:copper chaperone CopZ
MRSTMFLRTVTLALIASAPLALLACASSSTTTTNAPAAATISTDHTPIAGDSAVLLVHGMSCPKCANNIHVSLGQVPGVADSAIDLDTGRVTVQFDHLAKTHPSPAALAKVVKDSGFTLVGIE